MAARVYATAFANYCGPLHNSYYNTKKYYSRQFN